LTSDTPLEQALAHHREGRLPAAETLYRRALDANPADAAALHGLGLIAFQRADYATALDLIEDASQREPSNAVFLSNLAAVYQKLDMCERARACSERAIELDPVFADGYTNHGHALCALGRVTAAEHSYRKALELAPSPLTRLNAGLMRLAQGDYAAGFLPYEARLEMASSGDAERMLAALSDVPRWRGENLDGRHILVWTEQGLGDTLMMLRYLPLLKERGAARVTVCCEAVLARLVATVRGVDDVFSDFTDPQWPRRFDVHTPMMSLPLAFGTTLETIPQRVPYVEVPEPLRRAWAAKLANLRSPRVGLVWSGRRDGVTDPYRSASLASFAPVLAVRGVAFVSLQKGAAAAELAHAEHDIADWMDDCGDLLDTAGLIAELDLVVAVDTAVAHLAGALGKPTWLLKRPSGEWRWLLGRSDSPWYASMRIFRQREAGWTSVIDEVAQSLQSEIARPRPLLRRIGALFGAKP
jgi:ADP-heptose:LPS heptosyltransferase